MTDQSDFDQWECPAARCASLVSLLLMGFAITTAITSTDAAEPERQNMAFKKPYSLHPQPTYKHCTDSEDTMQLTDGETTSEYFWTQKGTVGWQHVQYATVTIDLGKVEPIGEVTMTTAAGVAGVTWPMGVAILVSDDGKTFYEADDLVALDIEANGSFPDSYAIRTLTANLLDISGRFVQLVIIPHAGGNYIFTDEIQICRGTQAVAPNRVQHGVATTAAKVYQEGRLKRSIGHRLQQDSADLEKLIENTDLEEAKRRRLSEELDAALRAQSDAVTSNGKFRAILPFGQNHATLFGIQATLWKMIGKDDLTAWVPPLWDPLERFSVPPSEGNRVIQVDLMEQEFRAAAVNLANSTDEPIQVRLRFKGLPHSPCPDYVTLHEVEWTDTSQGTPVAAALPDAKRSDDSWTVTVKPGLTRQVWMTFHAVGIEPADYSGSLCIQSKTTPEQSVPVRLKVWPFTMPREKELWLGGWSYTDGGGRCGITEQNRKEFLSHLQNRGVNAPWASSGVLNSYKFDQNDPTKIQLNTARMDDWLKQ
jgi:hypothetical protein